MTSAGTTLQDEQLWPVVIEKHFIEYVGQCSNEEELAVTPLTLCHSSTTLSEVPTWATHCSWSTGKWQQIDYVAAGLNAESTATRHGGLANAKESYHVPLLMLERIHYDFFSMLLISR